MGQMRIIYACDVGSTKAAKAKGRLQSFAWARLDPEDGAIGVSRCIENLIHYIGCDVKRGYSVSLGFEAPLFIPVPEDRKDLSKGREGEGNRP